MDVYEGCIAAEGNTLTSIARGDLGTLRLLPLRLNILEKNPLGGALNSAPLSREMRFQHAFFQRTSFDPVP